MVLALAAGFLVAIGFLVVDFLVVTGFLATGFFVTVDFFARAVGLTLAALAILATLALRREAVFFLRRPFLTALSYSDWTLLAFAAVGDFLKLLRAVLIFFLIAVFLAVRLTVCRAAFLADLMIGIECSFYYLSKPREIIS